VLGDGQHFESTDLIALQEIDAVELYFPRQPEGNFTEYYGERRSSDTKLLEISQTRDTPLFRGGSGLQTFDFGTLTRQAPFPTKNLITGFPNHGNAQQGNKTCGKESQKAAAILRRFRSLRGQEVDVVLLA